MLLFHGVYGRMYSLFLVTSLLSFLALLRAIDTGGRPAGRSGPPRRCSASRPPVRSARARVASRIRAVARLAAARGGARPSRWSLVLGVPFWRTDLVLAGRFEVGVGGGGERLGTPFDVLRYLGTTLGDFTAG